MRDFTGRRSRLGEHLLKALIYLCAFFTVALVVAMIGYIFVRGLPSVSWEFLTSSPSVLKGTIGILPNIVNTLLMIAVSLVFSVPIGIGAAIYLNEYARGGRLVRIIEFTVETLAGIPSIIYGLFGLMFFVTMMKLQTSIIAGALTLTIMLLPTLIRTTQEALKAVPDSFREGAIGLGATKWYTIKTVLLPSAKAGIVSAVILSVGRIVGESAALIFTAGIGDKLTGGFVSQLFSSGGTLTVALYTYAMGRGESADLTFAIASILVLIVLLINIFTMVLGKEKKTERD
ncbi:phosphate ABC transporter permease PstA [Neobittarella massiliensis]|uniref:Phosphate transport system permease protein PstA n=2 Tax=Oscillospiraceae TaxID=216572 RepID=A0A8J6LUD0_9FIRM|nr:phosphate ABC transporter permease PstA [Neobittarella massiliensis]MBC3516574.1 phosphate ABC transporter permease PstA [Neobittarella massiliensis]SCJ75994.1 Phosphate transport system permease protein pstA [uncultured Anaerotruncus sp.]